MKADMLLLDRFYFEIRTEKFKRNMCQWEIMNRKIEWFPWFISILSNVENESFYDAIFGKMQRSEKMKM